MGASRGSTLYESSSVEAMVLALSPAGFSQNETAVSERTTLPAATGRSCQGSEYGGGGGVGAVAAGGEVVAATDGAGGAGSAASAAMALDAINEMATARPYPHSGPILGFTRTSLNFGATGNSLAGGPESGPVEFPGFVLGGKRS